MGDIATAFVRLRPNAAGFQAEAEAELKGALTGAQKLLVAGLGVAGVAEGIKSLAEAASAHQTAIAITETAVKNAGAEWVVYGKTVEQILDQQARSTGISFQDLYQGFIRLEGPLKNTPLALKDLSLAEDVSRARGLQLAQVTTALVKAQEGNATSLQRLGILTPKVSAAQDYLKGKLADIKAAQTADTESKAKNYAGTIKLTDSQVALSKLSPVQLKDLEATTKAQLASAAATDKIATGNAAIAEVTKQYGGQATAFADTAAGSYDRFKVAVEEAEASLGTALLPTLSHAAQVAAGYADEVGKSGSAQEFLKQGLDDVGGAVQGVAGVIKAAEPELKVLQEILGAGGGAGVQALAFTFAAYKSLSFAIGLAQKAAGLFATTEAASVGATAAETAEVAAAIPVYSAATGEFVVLGEAAATAEAETTGLVATLAAIGAPELLGIAGVGAGLYLLNRYLDEGKDKLGDLRKGYAQLDQAGQTTKQKAADVKNLVGQYTSLASALAFADAQGGSKAGFATAAMHAEDAAKTTQDWIDKLRTLETSLGSSDPILKGQVERLANLAEETGKIPSRKTITIVLNDKTATDNLSLLQGQVDKLTRTADGLAGTFGRSVQALGQPSGVFGLDLSAAPLKDAAGFDKAVGATPPVEKASTELGKKAAAAFSTSFVSHIDVSGIATAFQTALTAAQGNLVTQTDAISSAIGSVLDERLRLRTLAAQNQIDAMQKQLDAETQARTARDDAAAVVTAQQKLAQLQSVYGTGALTSDQQAEIDAAKLALTDAQQSVADNATNVRIKQLQDSQQAATKVEAAQKTASSQRLSDLADELDKGRISYATYVKDVRAILAKENVNFKSAGKLLGASFADGFKDSVSSALAQAGILGDLGPKTLASAPRGTKATSPSSEEAKAIQTVINQIAGSGGRFTLDGKLPKGVNVAGLVSAAEAQRRTDSYREATKKQGDQALTYAQQSRDHLATAVALLRGGLHVTLPPAGTTAAKKARATAKATQS